MGNEAPRFGLGVWSFSLEPGNAGSKPSTKLFKNGPAETLKHSGAQCHLEEFGALGASLPAVT